MRKEYSKKTPEKSKKQSIQLDLFKVVSTKETDSQSLRLWESLANAVFEGNRNSNRIEGRFLDSTIEGIEFEGVKINIEKHPARIKNSDGFVDVFPQKKEYRVLEVLIKLAVDDMDSGLYINENNELNLGLMINLYSISKTIKQQTNKVKYSYSQIREAIEILGGTRISFISEKKIVSSPLISSYFSSLGDTTKNDAFLINFHPMISKLVKAGSFRQFNLSRTLSLPDIFTSWLYKKFVHNFKQASHANSYHFLLSSILKETPSIRKWQRVERKILKITESLNILTSDIVASYITEKKYEECNGGKRTIDCKFTVKFTKTFIDEQIRANKIKDNSIIYNDDGTIFEYPTFPYYKEKYKDHATAHKNYMFDLENWHKKKNQRKNNKIVIEVFKNAQLFRG